MIYTNLCNIKRYYGISSNMDTALQFIEKNNLCKLKTGKHIVDGDNIFINRFDYQTIPEKETFFEAHYDYADIHILLKGKEKVGISNIHTLSQTSHDSESDCATYKGNAECMFDMTCDKILIVFPEDAHKVKIQSGRSTLVEKIVVKVKL